MPDPEQQSIFLFYGEDTYSSHQKLNHWQKQFLQKYGEGSDIEIIEGKELKPASFLTNIEALPFLAEKRFLVIKDFLSKGKTENQKKVAEQLEKTPDFCILIFIEEEIPDKRTSLFQKLKKIGRIEEFKALSPREISTWILEQAKKREIKIAPFTANYLSTHSGPDLWTIANELEKLALFALDKEITTKMIDDIVTPSLTSSIFKLTDAIAAKNKKESLKVLKILIDSGEELTKIFFMIVRHFRILIQVHDMISKGEKQFSITKRLKQHPFVIQTTSNQAKNFTNDKLEKIFEKLLEIDTKVKTGVIKSYQGDNREFSLAIEKFIIQCCE